MANKQSWYVVSGNFRILCHTKESVMEWIQYVIDQGGAPVVEPAETKPTIDPNRTQS